MNNTHYTTRFATLTRPVYIKNEVKNNQSTRFTSQMKRGTNTKPF